MQSSYPYILLAAGVFIILNLVVSRFTSRFGAPTLMATLAIGLMFGNGGSFGFDYNYPNATLRISEEIRPGPCARSICISSRAFHG